MLISKVILFTDLLPVLYFTFGEFNVGPHILSHASLFQLQTQAFDRCEGYGSLIIFPPVMSEINYRDYCIFNNIS